MRHALSLLALTFAVQMAAACDAQQMEKRSLNLYEAAAFAAQRPRLGEFAPDLEMNDLNGKSVKLSDFTGKTVVFIKAGYT